MAKQRSHPSLNAIAREIGTSPATISRVLNGRPGIAEKTRKHVLKALEARGYPRHPVKGGMQAIRNSSATIAFAISSRIRGQIEAGDPFYGRHLLAIQSACSDFGIYPILIDHELDRTPSGSLRCVEEQRVFGVIAEWMEAPMVDALREHVGVVLLNRHAPVSKVDYVIPDIRQAAREQIQILFDLGHRSIACFRSLPGGWQNSFFWAEYWFQTYRHQLAQPPEFFEPIRYSLNEERQAIQEFLDRVLRSSNPPTAIVTSDSVAPLLIEECHLRGYSVPERMSIFGFDDRQTGSPIPLATYRQNFEGMAREAIRFLMDRCKEPNLPSRVIEVEGSTIVRASIAPPRPATR